MAVTTVLPNNYLIRKGKSVSKIPNGLISAFFVNTNNPISIVDHVFTDLRLGIYECDGTQVIASATALKKVDFPSNTYRVYWDDLVITTLTSGRRYIPVIYDNSTGDWVFEGSPFEFVDDSSTYVKVSFRHSSFIFNTPFETLTSFRNIVWLDLNLIDGQGEYDITSYPEKTSGFIRQEMSDFRDTVVLESFQFDPLDHAAMKQLSVYDDIELNDRPYQVKEGYKFKPNIKTNLAKGTIEFYDQEANEINFNE